MAKRTFQFILSVLLLKGVTTPAYAQISSPPGVPNLVFWVDAQDVNGTGTQPANGAVVSTWVDKSSGGNNLTTLGGTVTFESTGFDGTNPGLRFPLDARMGASNPFAGNFQDEMTVFFVNANVTQTRNFALSLNGTNQSTNIADGRFSFHTPWSDDNVYFDAGACCGSTRLRGPFPNAITETTLFSALNDAPGNSQLLRIDGQAFREDLTGQNANVSRGVHLGDLPSNIQYNGRFAEVVVYDRALNLSEIQDVECYLLLKWKPLAAPSTCAAVITVNKTVTPYESAGAGSYTLPGNDVVYTLTVTHEGGAALDDGTVFLVDNLPPEVTFYNDDFDDSGPEVNPVTFSQTNTSLTFNYPADVGFSTASSPPVDMASCNDTVASGYNPNIQYVCINPKGIFSSGDPDPSFSVSFRTQIK